MTSRKPAKITKPVIFYNGTFHYVEDNVNEFDDGQYGIFKVYNLNRSFKEFHDEVVNEIKVDDDSVNVTLIDESESSMDGSYIALNANIKIKISFKSKHRDVIENLRSSQAIKDLTQNGFADWVPLDSKSYINIERNSKSKSNGGIISTAILRTFNEDVDPNLLKTAINEIRENKIDSALEKLFPGPINTISREVHDVVMEVVKFELLYDFDEEIGKLFVEVLNSLIEDSKLEDTSEEFSEFGKLVYQLFAVIRSLMYLNEIYGEFMIPCHIPFISQSKLKEIRDKTSLIHSSEGNYLLNVEFTNLDDLDEPLEKLHQLVKQLQEKIEIAKNKIDGAVKKWKIPKQASSVLFYGSITSSIIMIPVAYFYNKRTTSTISSNLLKVSFGCLLSIVLVLSKKSQGELHKAIDYTKQINPLINSTKNDVELLEQLLNRITVDVQSKIKVNDEYKGRKEILKQLFHKLATTCSIVGNSFNVAL